MEGRPASRHPRGTLADLAAVKHAAENRKRAEKGQPENAHSGEPRFAIIPGKPEASLLVERIIATDEDEQMPPTPVELAAFVADASPDARQRVVDRLLASVDCAERMAAIWLDNARYADSNVYQFDNARTM